MILINDLSDDCLRMIFARLPLSSKLILHRICPRWRSLQYSVTSTHTSLTLHLGTGTDSRTLLTNSRFKIPHLDQIEPHNSLFSEHTSLELTKLSKNVICQLMQLLPSISALELCLNKCEFSEIENVLEIVRFWSSGLKHLSLYYVNICRHSIVEGFNAVMSHIRLINEHCLALDFLSIEIQGEINIVLGSSRTSIKRLMPNLELPCLAWLKEFRFYSKDYIDILFESLKSYANDNDRLEKIAIGNRYRYHMVGGHFQPISQLMSKITFLPCVKYQRDFSKFTSLTTLSVDMDSWTHFTTCLLPLKSLIHLKLCIRMDFLSQCDATPSYEIAQLPSIRIIQIELHPQTYRELQSRHWDWIFSSLHLLELQLLNQGEELIGWMQPTRVQVRAARLNLLLEPFKWQCSTLKRIVTLDKYFEGVDAEKKVWKLEGNNWEEVVQN